MMAYLGWLVERGVFNRIIYLHFHPVTTSATSVQSGVGRVTTPILDVNAN